MWVQLISRGAQLLVPQPQAYSRVNGILAASWLGSAGGCWALRTLPDNAAGKASLGRNGQGPISYPPNVGSTVVRITVTGQRETPALLMAGDRAESRTTLCPVLRCGGKQSSRFDEV